VNGLPIQHTGPGIEGAHQPSVFVIYLHWGGSLKVFFFTWNYEILVLTPK